jgi:hypothetical protein
LNGFWGFFNFGYRVIASEGRGFNLYPVVGLGASWMNMRLTERAVLDFSDVMTDPKRESYLSKWDFIIQGALGADYTIMFDKMSRGGKPGIYLGVRIGYQYSVTDSRWNMGSLDVSGGPKTGISGFYLRFSIGGAGYGGGHDWKDREGEDI